jgi:hypothetical protein
MPIPSHQPPWRLLSTQDSGNWHFKTRRFNCGSRGACAATALLHCLPCGFCNMQGVAGRLAENLATLTVIYASLRMAAQWDIANNAPCPGNRLRSVVYGAPGMAARLLPGTPEGMGYTSGFYHALPHGPTSRFYTPAGYTRVLRPQGYTSGSYDLRGFRFLQTYGA